MFHISLTGMMPLWIYAFGHFYLDDSHIEIPYLTVFRSLLTIVVPCAIGIIIRRFAPKVAEPIAKFCRPLSGIFVVYILTFGTYVNLYMYKIMGEMTEVLPAAMLLPTMGYLCGLLLALLARRSKSAAVTISIETGVQNASIPIIMLQGNFPQPEGDLAAVMPVASSLFFTLPLLIAWVGIIIYERKHVGKTVPHEDDAGDSPRDLTEHTYISEHDNKCVSIDEEKQIQTINEHVPNVQEQETNSSQGNNTSQQTDEHMMSHM